MMSPREIEARINELKGLDLRLDQVTVEYLKSRLFDLLEIYAGRTIHLQSSTHIFRARKNKGQELFESKAQLWCPKPGDLKFLSRANNIGQPVFYCCTDPETAIFEVRPKLNDVVTSWNVRQWMGP